MDKQNSVNIRKALVEYEARTGIKMTQFELGEKVFGIGNGGDYYLSRWKSGKDLNQFQPKHVRAICQILGCDANTLFQ